VALRRRYADKGVTALIMGRGYKAAIVRRQGFERRFLNRS
jgi:hypothetical protein